MSEKTNRLVGISILTAIVIVVQLFLGLIHVGSYSFALVLVPIVIGAALYGAGAGAVLGGVFGIIVFINAANGSDPGAFVMFTARPVLTAVLCVGKGVAAGAAAGIAYGAFKNKHIGTLVAAVCAPVVNTLIFLICVYFFYYDILVLFAGGSDILYFLFIGLAGINFILELTVNIALCPVIRHIIQVAANSRKPYSKDRRR